jgi:hypothetical protein
MTVHELNWHERINRNEEAFLENPRRIAKLQEQLKQAETREAERIGRIALKAGLGDIEVDEVELQASVRGTGETVSRRTGGCDRKEEGQWIAAAGRAWRGCGRRWRGLSG